MRPPAQLYWWASVVRGIVHRRWTCLEIGHVLRAWWLLQRVEWCTGRVGVETILERFAQPAYVREKPATTGVQLEVSALRRASMLPFGKKSCLVRSIALHSALTRLRIPSKLVVGVVGGSKFGAHAWVMCRGSVQPPEDVGHYRVIHAFQWPRTSRANSS